MNNQLPAPLMIRTVPQSDGTTRVYLGHPEEDTWLEISGNLLDADWETDLADVSTFGSPHSSYIVTGSVTLTLRLTGVGQEVADGTPGDPEPEEVDEPGPEQAPPPRRRLLIRPRRGSD